MKYHAAGKHVSKYTSKPFTAAIIIINININLICHPFSQQKITNSNKDEFSRQANGERKRCFPNKVMEKHVAKNMKLKYCDFR
jgi:hypothetical protein